MKHKSIIISVAALFVLGVFFGFRYVTLRSSHQKHIEDTYRRMTEMAKASATSGLPQMARALNRYYADHNAYPPHLNALYPFYIQNLSFISDIPWQYLPGGNNFMLLKSVSRDHRIMVATIDKDLRPKTPQAMIAEAPPPQTPTALAKNNIENVPAKVPVKIPPPNNGAPRSKGSPLVVLPSKGKELDNEKQKPVKRSVPSKIEHPSGAEDVTYEQLMALSKNYFVWKDKKGRLGFSNIQYPDKQEIALIFLNGEWQEFEE